MKGIGGILMKEFRYSYAQQLKKDRNYSELFEYLLHFSDSGNPTALNCLTECYYNGWGTDKDFDKCYYFDCIAATTSNPDSIAVLGFDYQFGVGVEKNIEKAVELYKQAVAMNSAKGKNYLAFCYEYGYGVESDESKAFELYTQAAGSGNVVAKRRLGLCYENGIGTVVDVNKAVQLYQEAAEQDNRIAQRYLAMAYENGDGIEQNIEKAIMWYKQAAERDDIPSCRSLGEFYYYGNVVEKNFDEATHWFKKAVDLDDVESMVYLADIYTYDYDNVENNISAVKYLKRVINDENKHYHYACYLLALLYSGDYSGIDFEPKEYYKYHKIAAEGGIEDSIYPLAKCYLEGIGTDEDSSEAIKWHKKSIEILDDEFEKAGCFYSLGNLYSLDDNQDDIKSKEYYSNAFECYKEVANQGDEVAELRMGQMCLEEIPGIRDNKRALNIFEKLSCSEDMGIKGTAIYYQATCYLMGYGTKIKLKKGFKLLKKSADCGKIIAKSHLIYFYLNGVGTRKNYKLAQKLMAELESMDNLDSIIEEIVLYYKGITYFHGLGVKKDIYKAKKYFDDSYVYGRLLYSPICSGDYSKTKILEYIYSNRKIAWKSQIYIDKKRAEEFRTLRYDNAKEIDEAGIKYYRNKFIKKSFVPYFGRKKAYKMIMDESITFSDEAALYRTRGQHYFYGCGTKKDYTEAIKNFEKSKKLNDDVSCVYLAYCYAYGLGVEKNYKMAVDILESYPKTKESCSNVLLGLLTYAGLWGVEKDKKKGIVILENNTILPTCSGFLSTERGDSFVSLFFEGFFVLLHNRFDQSYKFVSLPPILFRLLWLRLFRNPNSENLSRKEFFQLMLEQKDINDKKQEELELALSRLETNVNQIKSNTDAIPKIAEQQNEITNVLTSILECVSEQKQFLPDDKTLRFLDDAQIEDMQSRFVEETASKIIETIQGNTTSIEKEESLLRGLFGEKWTQIDEYTRNSLLSAKVLLDNCNSTEFAKLDHSGVVISATSALENELKQRLFVGFQHYLMQNYGAPSNGKWPELMVYRNKDCAILVNKSFTMGTLPYLFKLKGEDRNKFKEYISEIIPDIYQGKEIEMFTQKTSTNDSFVSRCEKIRTSYRNIAAHTGSVERSKAEACCNAIIGSSEASEKLGQVQGLLLELLQMTENYKY